MKQRLDETMAEQGMTNSRSQAQRLIKLGKVKVNGQIVNKQQFRVSDDDDIQIKGGETYVSRAGFKLASVAKLFKLDFRDKVVLDVGSSTGGFTDYALQHGAKKVIAVDVGTQQLHPTLRRNQKVELHEQTDIRALEATSEPIDIVVIDVSFISLREILPTVKELAGKNTQIVAMLKPQFEAGGSMKNKGVIKNNTMRRQILKDFEQWAKSLFVVLNKNDSKVSGQKGNLERFYLLKKLV